MALAGMSGQAGGQKLLQGCQIAGRGMTEELLKGAASCSQGCTCFGRQMLQHVLLQDWIAMLSCRLQGWSFLWRCKGGRFVLIVAACNNSPCCSLASVDHARYVLAGVALRAPFAKQRRTAVTCSNIGSCRILYCNLTQSHVMWSAGSVFDC